MDQHWIFPRDFSSMLMLISASLNNTSLFLGGRSPLPQASRSSAYNLEVPTSFTSRPAQTEPQPRRQQTLAVRCGQTSQPCVALFLAQAGAGSVESCLDYSEYSLNIIHNQYTFEGTVIQTADHLFSAQVKSLLHYVAERSAAYCIRHY